MPSSVLSSAGRTKKRAKGIVLSIQEVYNFIMFFHLPNRMEYPPLKFVMKIKRWHRRVPAK